MAVTINNRIRFPQNVVPLQLISGSTQDEHVGCGLVQYTVTGSATGTVAAADFGLTSIIAALRVDVAGSSAVHASASVTSGATDGEGFMIAVGPIA